MNVWEYIYYHFMNRSINPTLFALFIHCDGTQSALHSHNKQTEKESLQIGSQETRNKKTAEVGSKCLIN